MDDVSKTLLMTIEAIEPGVVLLSGGVDSSLVAAACARTQTACSYVFFDTPFTTQADRDAVEEAARIIDISVDTINTADDYWAKVKDNPRNRCYLCKSHLYSLVEKDKNIVDGTNTDDAASSDRPGLRANREFLVKSPLAMAGISKNIVRDLAKLWGLPMWNRPPQSCLATRFEFGSRIDMGLLPKIAELESCLRHEFDYCRARHKSDMLVIELRESDFRKGLRKKSNIIDLVRRCGLSQSVSLDFTGLPPA